MRPVERIKPLLDRLQLYWERNPDLRFGQLFENMKREAIYMNLRGSSTDGFFMEDDMWSHLLDQMLNRPSKFVYPANHPDPRQVPPLKELRG